MILSSKVKPRPKKLTCPKCGHKSRFTPYVDDNGNVMSEYGICDRINYCGYRNIPDKIYKSEHKYRPPAPISYIPEDIFNNAQARPKTDKLYYWLCEKFKPIDVRNSYIKYRVTSSKYWDTIFWYCEDVIGKQKIRSGKIIKYNNGKRDKTIPPYWIHRMLNIENFNFSSCLFGEHLLKVEGDRTPIYVVESEKTALILDITKYFGQDALVLATGGLQFISNIKVLYKFLNITLVPDLNAIDLWRKKAEEILPNNKLKYFDYYIFNPTEEDKNKGLDIADFILKTNERVF